MQQNKKNHQRGIGGAPTNYRRWHADPQKSAARRMALIYIENSANMVD